MTSVTKHLALTPQSDFTFFTIESPSYTSQLPDFNNQDIPFPFSYRNGVLDIDLIDDFETIMITTTGVAPKNEVEANLRFMGGKNLVTRLGPNFEAYIRAWRTGIDSGTPIAIYTQPLVQKIQWTRSNFTADESWIVSTDAPAPNTYTIGDEVNNYRTTYIFASPLTFTVVEGGVAKYITFVSRMHED
jgi:hypothetical protein